MPNLEMPPRPQIELWLDIYILCQGGSKDMALTVSMCFVTILHAAKLESFVSILLAERK